MNPASSTQLHSPATVGYDSLLQPMGVDIGNGQLKLCSPLAETLTESYVCWLPEKAIDTVKGYVEYHEGDRADLKATQWIAGRNAYYSGVIHGLERVTDHKEGKPKLGLQILLSALCELPHRESWQIAIAVSVHDGKTLAGALKRSLEGTHRIKLRNKPTTVSIKVLTVLEEGTGAVIHYQKSVDTTNALVYDLGNGTLIVSAFNGLRMNDRKYSQNGGVEKLIDQIATHETVRERLKKEGDRHLIRKGIEDRSFTYGTQHPDWNFESAYRQELPLWVKAVLAPTVRPWEDLRDSATALIAIGGGAALPGIESLLLKKGIKVLPDPLWANARGLYSFATRKTAGIGS